jgi:hypothetical protein
LFEQRNIEVGEAMEAYNILPEETLWKTSILETENAMDDIREIVFLRMGCRLRLLKHVIGFKTSGSTTRAKATAMCIVTLKFEDGLLTMTTLFPGAVCNSRALVKLSVLRSLLSQASLQTGCEMQFKGCEIDFL